MAANVRVLQRKLNNVRDLKDSWLAIARWHRKQAQTLEKDTQGAPYRLAHEEKASTLGHCIRMLDQALGEGS